MEMKKLIAGLAACALSLSVMTACDSEKKKAETAKKKTTKTATKADPKETKTKTTKTAKATKTTRTTKTTKATKATKDTKEKDDFSEVKKTIGKKILDLFTEEVDEEEAKKR